MGIGLSDFAIRVIQVSVLHFFFFAWTMKVKKPISSQLNSVLKHT